MRPAIRACGATLLLAVLVVGCGSTESGSGGTTGGGASGVTITRAFTFDPTLLSVDRGATVTWTNTDIIQHTVTSGEPGAPTGRFDKTVEPTATFSFTFADAGTYDFFCNFHRSMVGQIVVR
jgi:plastocyanin